GVATTPSGWIQCFFFSSRRRHTSSDRDWSSDVCSSDLCCGGRSQILLDDRGETVEGGERVDVGLPADRDVVGPLAWRRDGKDLDADIGPVGATAAGAALAEPHAIREPPRVDE